MDKPLVNQEPCCSPPVELDMMRLSALEDRPFISPAKSWVEHWFPRRDTTPRSLLLVIERAEPEPALDSLGILNRYLAWVAQAGGYGYHFQDFVKFGDSTAVSQMEQMLHDLQRHPALALITSRDSLGQWLAVKENEPHPGFSLPIGLLKLIHAKA